MGDIARVKMALNCLLAFFVIAWSLAFTVLINELEDWSNHTIAGLFMGLVDGGRVADVNHLKVAFEISTGAAVAGVLACGAFVGAIMRYNVRLYETD